MIQNIELNEMTTLNSCKEQSLTLVKIERDSVSNKQRRKMMNQLQL